MDTLKLRMKQRSKGQTKTQRQGAFPDISTVKMNLLKILKLYTQGAWIFILHNQYESSQFIWCTRIAFYENPLPCILMAHSWIIFRILGGRIPKGGSECCCSSHLGKGNKWSKSTTQTGAHYLEETTEPTQRALTLHLLHTWRQNTHKLYSEHNPNTPLTVNCHLQFMTEHCN